MQTTSVQLKTRTAHGVRQEASGTVGKSENNAELMDPFLQIIMNLLTQVQDQSTQQDSTMGLTGTVSPSDELAALFQSSPEGLAALQNLLQLQSGGINADTALNSGYPADAAALVNLLAKPEASDAASPNIQIFETGENIAPSAKTEQLADVTALLNLLGKSADKAETVAISSDALTQLTDLLGLSSRDETQTLLKNAGIEVTSNVQGSAQTSNVQASAQNGISEVVVKAKELLSEQKQPQQSDKDDIDIDKLQNELVKLDKTAPFEIRFKPVGNLSDTKVLEQITDGIKQNISLGKSEFIIKLKPETLGEITVKLVEEAGKTTLTITAAKEMTAKLINNDLDALREAVAPMKVEVRDAVVSTNETANGSMQQFNMTGQQFAGQQFAGHQSLMQMSQTALGQADNQSASDIYESQAAQTKFRSSDRLDAYI
ncbi:MAG: flagellar hook-length control protein FliK [Oscillospiraceae bacterium]